MFNGVYVANIMHVWLDTGSITPTSGSASGHRVALMVHRAEKTLPDLPDERPTFAAPLLDSWSFTAIGNAGSHILVIRADRYQGF